MVNNKEKKELEKEFKCMTPDQLLKEWLKLKKQEKEVELRSEVLREKLLKEVTKKYPDEKRSARIEVDEYHIIRSAVPKIEWDKDKLKKLIGKSLYEQIIEIEEHIDEKKLKTLVDGKKIKMSDVEKSCEIKFSKQLRVNLRSKDKSDENELRPLVEDMCR
jgi:hypothetical protein